MDEKQIRELLGIDDDADIGEAIKAMKATVAAQKAVIETDKGKVDAAEVAQLRSDLASARSKLIIEETENAHKIAAIEERARKDRVEATVDRAIAKGKPPRTRDQLIEYGMSATSEALDALIDTIPTIDMTERGVASGTELADLEPSQSDYKIARDMGFHGKTEKEWRVDFMRSKAKEKNLTLPEGIA